MSHDVSVIIPVYNGSNEIRRSVESVLAQSRRPAEIIIVDDGSTDGTAELVQGYGPAVRLVRQVNAGAAAARNCGARHASGDWLAFLDHDDEWLPNKLDLQAQALEADPAARLCYSAYWFYSHGGRRQPTFVPVDQVRRRARFANPFPPSVVLINKDAFHKLGGFRSDLKTSCEDWEFFARVLNTYPVTAVAEPCANYFENEASNSLKDYRLMLENTLSIVESSILAGLDGANRALWRRRVKAVLYFQAALTARRLGEGRPRYVLQSMYEWPFPEPHYKRLRFLAALTVKALAVTTKKG